MGERKERDLPCMKLLSMRILSKFWSNTDVLNDCSMKNLPPEQKERANRLSELASISSLAKKIFSRIPLKNDPTLNLL